MRTSVATSWKTLEGVDVECTHCGIRMTAQHGTESAEKYFKCSSCRRIISSTYSDVLKADAKVRTYPKRDDEVANENFESVKGRLERWLAAIEDQDPYHLLGVSPLDSAETIRARYRELAMQRHPDRGGSEEQMRAVNGAYERVLRHRASRRNEPLSTGAAKRPWELPGSRRHS